MTMSSCGDLSIKLLAQEDLMMQAPDFFAPRITKITQ